MEILYRDAAIEDVPQILQFVKDLAIYEKEPDAVSATEKDLEKTLFGPNPKAFCIMAEVAGVPAGFAVCFYNYSTWLGKAGIYIEDIFVTEEYRGKGIGTGFFQVIIEKAQKEDCGRVEWMVLDWNAPSIEFYEKMGAKPMKEWITYRLEGQAVGDGNNLEKQPKEEVCA